MTRRIWVQMRRCSTGGVSGMSRWSVVRAWSWAVSAMRERRNENCSRKRGEPAAASSWDAGIARWRAASTKLKPCSMIAVSTRSAV
ncbi:MAG: hypothetical protein IT436_10550 [Phycisphaerales bacterium]|nr:hypothetical protein [Phycisphaerales bacterium]